MTLVEDAQRLDRLRNVDCLFCNTPASDSHPDWCPVPRIPRLIAALEALGRFVAGDPSFVYREDYDAYQALVAALRGEATS
jgi:hypothetical protein